MMLKVIGTGVGRTGTYSLKTALNELGVGPTYHMEEVMKNMSTHLPMWVAAGQGKPDFASIYQGYGSAVDWPTSGYYRELFAAYPKAKFIHTTRSAESWAESFSETIYKLLAGKQHGPKDMLPWLDMAEKVITKTGFPPGLDMEGLTKAFNAHDRAVKAAIPAKQLLVFEVKDGWKPLCAFLGTGVPNMPFPRSNNRQEFWDLVAGKN